MAARRDSRAPRTRPRVDPVIEIALNYYAQLLDLSDVPLEQRARLLMLQRQILEAISRA